MSDSEITYLEARIQALDNLVKEQRIKLDSIHLQVRNLKLLDAEKQQEVLDYIADISKNIEG